MAWKNIDAPKTRDREQIHNIALTLHDSGITTEDDRDYIGSLELTEDDREVLISELIDLEELDEAIERRARYEDDYNKRFN